MAGRWKFRLVSSGEIELMRSLTCVDKDRSFFERGTDYHTDDFETFCRLMDSPDFEVEDTQPAAELPAPATANEFDVAADTAEPAEADTPVARRIIRK